jgi:hypothetical protein
MKKSVLLFVGLLLTTVSAFAQPAKPTVTYTDWASVEEKSDIYLYNVEAGMFLSAGSDWGTRATLVGTGWVNTYNDLIMGKGEFKGNKWFIAVAQDARDGKTCYMFENKSGKNYLTADSKDGIWVDGDASRPYDGWYIAKDNGDKTFQLGYMLRTEKKDEAGNVVKEDDKTVYDYSSMGIFGVQKFEEGNLNTFLDESTAYSTWAIVSVEEYEAKLPAFKLYYISEGLKQLLANAEALGLGGNYEEQKALLTDDGATYDDIKAAITKISPAINFGKVIVDAEAFDAARGWEKYVAIYADPASTDEDFTTNTNLINAFIALKKALNEAKELDGAKTYAHAEALYGDDEAAQADIEAETKRINAYISLKKILDEAIEKGCNVTEYAAVYNNADATAEALAEAEEAVKGVINAKDIADSVKDASADNPANLSRYIVNATFDTVGDFKGWSTGFGAGGATSTCAEVWRKAFDVYQDIKGLPEGVYMVACNGYSRHNDNHNDDYVQWKSGAVSDTKIYMKSETHGQYFTPVMFVSQGGSVDQQIGTGDQTSYVYEEEGTKHTLYCPNSMAAANDYFHDGTNRYHNEAYGPLAAGETLRIGVSNTNSMYWSIFDDFQLFYLGNGADAYKKWAESVKANYNVSFDGEVYYGAPDKNNYEEILATLSDAGDKDAVSAAILNVDAAVEAVTTSKTNYAAYVNTLANAQKWLDENFGDDDTYYKLSDYMEAEDAESVAGWEFPNGPVKVIIPDYLVGGYEGILSGEDIATETTYLQNLLAEAAKNALADGSDLTNLIINPGFEEAGGKGWNLDTSKGGTSSLTNWHGGNANNYCAEAFQQNFDIYQEIEGVKDGLYEVSVQAFYRTGANQAAYEAYTNDPEMKGDAKVYPEVYINEFSSKIRNVMEIQFADKELDENNTNTYHPDGTEIYTLDGMTSASNAFSLENPARNFTMSAYGVVQDGKIRIGLRKLEGPTNAAQWTLWDNFKLIYRAKNPEVAAKVLASKSQELGDLLETEEDNLTDPAKDAATYAYNESRKTSLSDAAKYDVLIETNDALLAAKENIKKVAEYKAASDAYDAAVDELKKVDENEEEAIWDDIIAMDDELQGDAYAYLTTEEVDELTAKVEKLTEDVKATTTAIQNKAIYEEMATSTDEDPYDATGFIVNPDMGTGNADGWTVMPLGQNNGYQDNNTYTNGDISLSQFIECWRNGAILTDGTIEQTTAATLPAGTYTLSADINAKWQNDATVAIEGLFLFVSNSAGNTNSVLLDTQTESPKHFEVTFKLEEASPITLGLMAKSTNANWLAADNFKLMYYGTASTKEASGDAGDASGLENVTEQNAVAIEAIYNAAGTQISTLQPGINIVKYTDGSTRKIFKQ